MTRFLTLLTLLYVVSALLSHTVSKSPNNALAADTLEPFPVEQRMQTAQAAVRPEIPPQRLQEPVPPGWQPQIDPPLTAQIQTPQRLLRPDIFPQRLRQQPAPAGPKAEIDPPRLVVTQGQPATFASKSVADPDVPIATYQWIGPGRQTSNSQRFVVNTANLTPSTYTVTLIVRDRRQRQNQVSAALIVSARSRDDVPQDNRPPMARITPGRREVQQGQKAQFDGSRSADPDSKIRAWTWSLDGRQINRGRAVVLDTANLKLGDHTVSLEVIDDRGARNSTEATLTITPPPTPARPPVAIISPDRSRVTQGVPVRFFSKSYHPDRRRKIIRTFWQTSWGQRASGDHIDIDTRELSPGAYSIGLNVVDDNEASDTSKAVLIIEAARAPIPPVAMITPDRRRVIQGARVSFSDASYHPSRDIKIVSRRWSTQWGQTQAGNTLNVDTSSLSPGAYWITLQVVDQNRRTDSAKVTLEIVRAPQTQQPPIARIAPRRIEVRQGQQAQFDGSGSTDPDGKIRAWMWSLNDRSMDRRPSAHIDTRGLEPGEYRVRLQVTDEQGLSARDEALLIVAEPPRDFDAAIVDLTVSPAPASPHREVQIRAVVANRGKDSLRNVPVRFEIGGVRVAEKILPSLAAGETREVTASWIPKTAGEQIVIATVNPENQPPEGNRTNNFRRHSIAVLAQANVRIDPSPLEVSQGDLARFTAQVSIPGQPRGRDITYFWRGPGNRIGEGAEFQFDTSELAPGSHNIVLEISERNGFKATAGATLIVRPAKAEVWLAADNQNPETGTEVTFTTGTRPDLSQVQYKLIFGDGAETEWRAGAEAVHRYDQPGDYTARLLARRNNVDLGETSILINVKDIAYAVSLRTETPSVRTGDPLEFIASIEPPADDTEYRFIFGDGQESGWTRSPTASHSYSGDGAFEATVEARISGARIFRSPITRVSVAKPNWSPWIWFGAGFIVLSLGATAYIRNTRLLRNGAGITVVPRLSLEHLRVETHGKVNSGCDISLRTGHGQSRFDIEASGPIVGGRNE
jgi:CARDB/PKD domain